MGVTGRATTVCSLGKGFPFLSGEGSVHPPRKNFDILYVEMVNFGLLQKLFMTRKSLIVTKYEPQNDRKRACTKTNIKNISYIYIPLI